jgi:hypothetical protein
METGWLELMITSLTTLAVALFVTVGFALRRYAGARHSGRPVQESLMTRLFRRSRLFKIRNFSRLSSAILIDAKPLVDDTTRVAEARAFRPLVSELRKQGEHLLASRRWYHCCTSWWKERELEADLEKITDIELILRALPCSELTLEDVLAGRFPEASLVGYRSS